MEAGLRELASNVRKEDGLRVTQLRRKEGKPRGDKGLRDVVSPQGKATSLRESGGKLLYRGSASTNSKYRSASISITFAASTFTTITP